MFDLEDAWVWDFWLAQDQAEHHLFFLHAPRTLGDPDLRHEHARIGHAVGTDLVHWQRLPDPLSERVVGFDDLAQWTGCVVHDGVEWWLFTTGRTHADGGRVQRIGAARSHDLREWRRTDLVLEADPAWYDTSGDAVAWRDPWVLQGANGTWHLLATARTGGPGSGVIGHATSRDLRTWTSRPPLSEPTGCFEWLEVIQVARVAGRTVALFNCLSAEMVGAPPGSGGVWTLPVDGPPGTRVEADAAVRLTDETHYVGKLVPAADGSCQLLTFRNRAADGSFVGGVTDPVPVAWRPDGRGLEVRGGRGATTPLV